MGDERGYVGEFRLFRSEEFFSGRHIEEEIADGDRGAGAAGDVVATQHFSAGDFDARAGLFLGRAGFEKQPGNRSDGRQGFAAKAQSRDGEQVLYIMQFGGRVALEGKEGVVAKHAATIVRDADESAAAGFDFDADTGGSGV